MMDTGRVEQFYWLESVESDFPKILKLCREVLIGKCVVISCFDSGPLQATKEELAEGWQQLGDLVIVPRVDAVNDLPFDNYDEWYIFPTYTIPEITQVFVNAPMTLRIPELLLHDYHAHGDAVGARRYAEQEAATQLMLWHEIKRINPESYLGFGDQLIFVSQNPDSFSTVLRALQ
jgi:hypothetical protein